MLDVWLAVPSMSARLGLPCPGLSQSEGAAHRLWLPTGSVHTPPAEALLLGPCEGDQVLFHRTMSSLSPRTLTAPVTSKRNPWTNPMTSSATVPPRATTLGRLGWGRTGVGVGCLGHRGQARSQAHHHPSM